MPRTSFTINFWVELVELAGPDAHVMLVSDHGFQNGPMRPMGDVDPAEWHRNFGVFVLAGPGIKRDAILHGATLLDICPTVLTLFGLPVGSDMEGKVLVNAFEVARIRAHSVMGRCSRSGLRFASSRSSRRRSRGVRGSTPATRRTRLPGGPGRRCEARHRAPAGGAGVQPRVHVYGRQTTPAGTRASGGTGSAVPRPGAVRRVRGPSCRLGGGCRRTGSRHGALEKLKPEHKQLSLFRGFECWFANDIKGALRHFEDAVREGRENSWLLCRIGRAYLRLRRWSEAESAFRKSLLLDAENFEAYYGLSVALPRQGRYEEGIEFGLQAVSRVHDFPLAHFQLGAVLSRIGWYDRAVAGV